jgi:hypothetical protein
MTYSQAMFCGQILPGPAWLVLVGAKVRLAERSPLFWALIDERKVPTEIIS